MKRSSFITWLRPGIHIKRWILLLIVGIALTAVGIASGTLKVGGNVVDIASVSWLAIIALVIAGIFFIGFAILRLTHNVVAPFRRFQALNLAEAMAQHNKLSKGPTLVAIGGGTGLPVVLKGMKAYTENITAIVTVADDGGSSGRLRRDMGIVAPGDLRNNLAALANDDSLLTQLFQYRFLTGDLQGHVFGNLFIAALAEIVEEDQTDQQNSLAEALIQAERVLNIRGRVLPSTVDDVTLKAIVKLTESGQNIEIQGESTIEDVDGTIERIQIEPPDVDPYPLSIQAILDAELIVLGPGSLFTSILPNLLIPGIQEALRASKAYKIYICNVATQPVETDAYSVADHILMLEKHIGRGMFHAVLANSAFPDENKGDNTIYVQPVPHRHEVLQRYEIQHTDLTDNERPWRHDPEKLAKAILRLSNIHNA